MTWGTFTWIVAFLSIFDENTYFSAKVHIGDRISGNKKKSFIESHNFEQNSKAIVWKLFEIFVDQRNNQKTNLKPDDTSSKIQSLEWKCIKISYRLKIFACQNRCSWWFWSFLLFQLVSFTFTYYRYAALEQQTTTFHFVLVLKFPRCNNLKPIQFPISWVPLRFDHHENSRQLQ